MAVIPESVRKYTTNLLLPIYYYSQARWHEAVDAAMDLIDAAIGSDRTRISNLETEVSDARGPFATLVARLLNQDTERNTIESRVGGIELFLEGASDFNQDNPAAVSNVTLNNILTALPGPTSVIKARSYSVADDHDGGAWVEKMSHTSWEQALGKFPAAFVLTVETAKLHIHDGADGALWATYDLTGLTLNDVAYRNGVVYIATTTGIIVWDYAADKTGHTTIDYSTTTTPAIVNDVCNAVAVIALVGAPLNYASLPVNTITVGTAGGVSVIHGPAGLGTVTNSLNTSSVNDVWITRDVLYWSYYLSHVFVTPLSTTVLSGFGAYVITYESKLPEFYVTKIKSRFLAPVESGGLCTAGSLGIGRFFIPAVTSGGYQGLGMHAHITNTYNTGYQVGDSRLACLCDTDTGAIAATSELVINGTFDTDTVWTKGVGWTIGAGVASCDGTQTANTDMWEDVTVEAGKTYVVSFEVLSRTAGQVKLSAYNTETASALGEVSYTTTPGVYHATFTAIDSSIRLIVKGDIDFVGSVDNVSMWLATPDRSVKGNGLKLISNGGLTRTALGGAGSLAAWSGFDANNYIEQPYSADLDFGAGDFYIKGWFKTSPTATQQQFFHRKDAAGTGGGNIGIRLESRSLLAFISDDNGVTVDLVSTPTVYFDDAQWHLVEFYVESGILYLSADGMVRGSTSVTAAALGVSNVAAVTRFGAHVLGTYLANLSSLALWHISATVPSAEQRAEIYRTEKAIIDGQACVLPGASSAVLDVAYDEQRDELTVTQADYVSVFRDLVRVDALPSSVGTLTSAASNRGALVQGGSTGAHLTAEAVDVKAELAAANKRIAELTHTPKPFTLVGSTTSTVTLPKGYRAIPGSVIVSGSTLLHEGAANDWTQTTDGFVWTVTFAAAQTGNISIPLEVA